jgi:hypothetical protein
VTRIVLIVRKVKVQRLLKRRLRLDLLIVARRLIKRAAKGRFRENDSDRTTRRPREENNQRLHDQRADAEQPADTEALEATTETLSRIRDVEISFLCAACGQQMDELTESGLCIGCNEIRQSFPERRRDNANR